MKDAAQRVNGQYLADTMRICRLLTNTVTGMQFGEERHVIGPRLLRGLLAQRDTLRLSDEIAAVECLTQFGPGHQREITDEEWAIQRRENAPLVLHAWQRLQATIDPNFDMNQTITLQPELPAGAFGAAGMAPEGIDDPQLRAQYEANIERHGQLLAKLSEQHEARNLEQTFIPFTEKYLVNLYSHLPDDREEFGKFLDTYGIDAKTKTRMLEAIAGKLEKQGE